MDFAQFIGQYGYLALLIGSLLEGETFVALAGFAASRGYLDLTTVIAIATLGAVLSCQFCFQIGRRVGPRVLNGIPNSAGAAARVRRLTERYPTLIIIGIHFLYGVRTVGLFVIGMSGVSGWRFFWLNIVGSIITVSIVATTGYLFGNVVEVMFGDLRRHDRYIFGGIALLAIVGWLALRLRRQFSARP